MRPIDGIATLLQAQNAQELLNSAQREAAIAQLRHEAETERTKDIQQTSVMRKDEAAGKSIRDDDPRRERQHRRNPDEELGNEKQDRPPEHIDIVV